MGFGNGIAMIEVYLKTAFIQVCGVQMAGKMGDKLNMHRSGESQQGPLWKMISKGDRNQPEHMMKVQKKEYADGLT